LGAILYTKLIPLTRPLSLAGDELPGVQPLERFIDCGRVVAGDTTKFCGTQATIQAQQAVDIQFSAL